MSEANENALSDWSMARAHECIEQYRDNRDYPAKAGAMFAMAIVLYNEAVRARARITALEALLAPASKFVRKALFDYSENGGWSEDDLEAAEIAKGTFQIGDAVEIVLSDDPYHWTHDWARIPLWVAGIDWCPVDGVSYTVTDKWPLPTADYRGHLTDGFQPYSLSRRAVASIIGEKG